MLTSFRRLSKSKAGTAVVVLFLVVILASFAVGDISNLSQGGGGLTRGTLVSVGDEQLTEAQLQTVFQRELARLREQKPDATYADLAPQFDEIVNSLVQERTLKAYAREHGLLPSKKLIDAEIVKIPSVRGLDGKFSEPAYRAFLAQQRLTDADIRNEITTSLLQRLLLSPLAANTRIPLGVARPYASMLLEEREGEVALIPAASFRGGAAPTDAELSAFYAQNRQRYLVPEQRSLRLAPIGAAQLGATAPTEAEIAAYYKANQASYGVRETRVLSRVSVTSQIQATQIAANAKTSSFAAAAAPAGYSAADVSLGPQGRDDLTRLAGAAVADQVFAASAGAIVGPVKSNTGWDVVKVERIDRGAGRSLPSVQAEIAARLAADKRKEALTDLVAKIEDQISEGRNFSEIASANKLTVTQTPPLIANGQSRRDPAFKLPGASPQLLRDAFAMTPDEDPVVETLPGDAGYLVLQVAEILPAAAPPLAQIRDRVTGDFLVRRALDRARAAANLVVAKANSGVPLPRAMADAKITAAPAAAPLKVRRLQLAQLQGRVPAPLQMLFSLAPGKARLVGAPDSQGYFVVKLNRITPGDASTQPNLIATVQGDFNRAASEELAVQFLLAAQKSLGVKRNETAIADARKRLISGN